MRLPKLYGVAHYRITSGSIGARGQATVYPACTPPPYRTTIRRKAWEPVSAGPGGIACMIACLLTCPEWVPPDICYDGCVSICNYIGLPPGNPNPLSLPGSYQARPRRPVAVGGSFTCRAEHAIVCENLCNQLGGGMSTNPDGSVTCSFDLQSAH